MVGGTTLTAGIGEPPPERGGEELDDVISQLVPVSSYTVKVLGVVSLTNRLHGRDRYQVSI